MKEEMPLVLKDKWLELKGTLCPKSIPWIIDNYAEDPYAGRNLIEIPSRLQYELSSYSPDIIFICVYTTYITIKAHKSSTQIFGQEIYLKRLLDKLRLTRWDKIFRREILLWRFYAYNDRLSEFILPRYALKELIKCIEEQGGIYKLIYENPIESTDIEIPGLENWVDRAEQVRVIDWLSNPNIGPIRATQLQTGKGKGTTLDSLIKIPNGWKRMGDIEIGDEVITQNGEITTVTGVFPQGKKDIFRVSFKDGRFVEVDNEHLWKTFHVNWVTKNKDGWEIKNTDELKNKVETSNRCPYVPLCNSEQNEDLDLPIDPYVLGVLLGDGGLSVSHVVLLSTDDWILEHIKTLIPETVKVNIKPLDPRYMKVEYFREGSIVGVVSNINPLKNELKKMGLMGTHSWDKFIPDIYLHGSHKQRLALVQGLMDTDGCINKPKVCRNGVDYGTCGTIEFSSASKELAEGLQYLIRSLGGICSLVVKENNYYTYNHERRKGRPAYRLGIRYPNPNELFRLPRKKNLAPTSNQYSDNLKLGFDTIEHIGKKETQCISVDHPSGLYITNDFIVTHNTACAIRSASRLNKPTLIICSGLTDQWEQSFYKTTKLTSDDIFIIKGFPSLKKLFKENKDYKVYIASIETLRSWITNQDDTYRTVPSYCQFLVLFKIGTKIVDEFHLNFSAITSIDFRSNVENNIYLSATPARSDKNSNRIFNMIFPINTIDASSTYDKYVHCTTYTYRFDITNPRKLTNKFGYNHIKYETQICANEDLRLEYFTRILKPVIDSHYINKFDNGKLLILVQTVQLVHFLLAYCEYYFPGKVVKSYVHGDSDDNLRNSDIIISTPKSAGTGTDIENLVCCLNTISVSSEPLVKQIFGRLRKLPDGRTPEFVDMCNRLIPDQIRHMKSRRRIYEKIALKLEEFDI